MFPDDNAFLLWNFLLPENFFESLFHFLVDYHLSEKVTKTYFKEKEMEHYTISFYHFLYDGMECFSVFEWY